MPGGRCHSTSLRTALHRVRECEPPPCHMMRKYAGLPIRRAEKMFQRSGRYTILWQSRVAGVGNSIRFQISIIRKRPAYAYPAGKKRGFDMAMKKKKQKKNSAEARPANKTHPKGVTNGGPDCTVQSLNAGLSGVSHSISGLLNRTRAYFQKE